MIALTPLEPDLHLRVLLEPRDRGIPIETSIYVWGQLRRPEHHRWILTKSCRCIVATELFPAIG